MGQAVQIRDVNEATFAAEVLEASLAVPVVVDFWAPWCQPCHQLAPVLERVAARYADEVRLVKVDIDQAPALARQYGVQGIPAVKGFKDGSVATELTGVQPEAVVERLFAALAPSEADRLVAAAGAATGAERERLLAAAVSAKPDHPAAVVGLARVLADRGEVGEALGLLERLPGDAEAAALAAQLALGDDRRDTDELDRLRAQADAGDATAAVEYGRALAGAGEYEGALRALVGAVADPRVRDDAQTAVLDVFAVLGADHELVRVWRPRLAAALF